jgi:hypothetical protein
MSKFQNYSTTPSNQMVAKWHYENANGPCTASEVRKELRKFRLSLRRMKKLQASTGIHAVFAAGFPLCEARMWNHR